MILTLERFGGLAPRVDPAKLPQHGATVAMDVRLQSGALRGWRKPKRANPSVLVPLTTRTIYYDTGSDAWFAWDEDVDIVPGPVADLDIKRRYYYTGAGVPKKTDSDLALVGTGAYPRTVYNLGVPAPDTVPVLTNDGLGTGTAEDHVYVFTYISEFSGIEEESAPSPPVTDTGWQPGDTVTLTWADTVPTTGYNITKRRIYRSNGSAYLYVGEQGVANASFADNVPNDALGEGLTSLTYDTPPDDLTGLISMPNGFLAGFVGNQIYFSEAYQPHAWPIQYALTVAEQIVALAPVAQGCYVFTEGSPYFVTGVSPDAMTAERINKFAPCLSKRSVATDGVGVLCASYNGVAYVSGGDVKTITEQLFTQEEWNALNPETMLGIFYDERYTLWYG